MNALTSKL